MSQPEPVRRSRRTAELALPAVMIGVVVAMVLPLPTPLLDLLLAANLSLALVILLTATVTERTLDLSVFPSLLLITTLARLALNVSSTRLILLNGDAGHVISAFGHFVVGGNLVVGLVVFAILVVIQFAVITNGAGRVAEVSARFTLDAMPGKQMAIDADLNAGLCTEDEARRRRVEVAREADFFGAMDGASKFVKGDAIAAVVIVVVNLIGGVVVGVVLHHLSISDALQRYSLLSVGDGLVSQIPALLISVASGIVVTRADSDTGGGLGGDLVAQLTGSARTLRIAAAAVGLIGVLPGLPKLPFVAIAIGLLVLSSRPARAGVTAEDPVQPEPANPDSREALIAELHVPVVLDEAFLKDRLGTYVHGKGVTVFVTDGTDMVTKAGTYNAPRHLRERITRMHEFISTLGGWYDQVKVLPKPTLVALMKLGGKIARFIPGSSRKD